MNLFRGRPTHSTVAKCKAAQSCNDQLGTPIKNVNDSNAPCTSPWLKGASLFCGPRGLLSIVRLNNEKHMFSTSISPLSCQARIAAAKTRRRRLLARYVKPLAFESFILPLSVLAITSGGDHLDSIWTSSHLFMVFFYNKSGDSCFGRPLPLVLMSQQHPKQTADLELPTTQQV